MGDGTLLTADFTSPTSSLPTIENLPKAIQDGLAFERENYVDGPVSSDPFYDPPADSTTASPGTIFRIDNDIDASKYLIPPGTALTRILYQSINFADVPTPISAFILWPYTATPQPDGGYPVVAWAHGTSGLTPSSAPSKMKNLWQHFLGPYQLALQGYVVVATDYAGLGVSKRVNGESIQHEYLVASAHANDVVYSVQAARQAYPELSKDWVAVGHSQGGGAVWAVAERQVHSPVDGYLGAVPIAPVTRIIDISGPLLDVLGTVIAPSVKATNPDFSLSNIVTPEGIAALDLMHKTGAHLSTTVGLLNTVTQSNKRLLKENWKSNPHVQNFQSQTATGRKPFAGPMLVIFGEADIRLSAEVCTSTVEETAKLHPEAKLTYVLLPEITHTPALNASQRIWMDWIAERFRGVEVEGGYKLVKPKLVRPVKAYAKEQNWWIAGATEYYHAP